MNIENQQFTKAYQLFEKEVSSKGLMCQIVEKYEGLDVPRHNCLGCNLSDQEEQILMFLLVASENTVGFSFHHLFSIYALLLNNLWERITDVFDILCLPEGYRYRHFNVFIRMRRWANFFKHPKHFGWMVHHPEYLLRGSERHQDILSDIGSYLLIDENFLKKYYSSSGKQTEGKLRGEFESHKESTIVLLPNMEELTSQICQCLVHFVDIVTQNPVYIETLSDTSTLLRFYETDDEFEENN